MKKDEAKKYLARVSDDKVFWVNNGPVLRSLEDLEANLHSMSEQAYSYHANKDRNDFSNWIGAVIGDKLLAMDLTSARNKESAHKKVKNRIHSLKKMAN